MLSSKSRLSIKSPINAVPYDVLLEIFIHCLPENRFEIRQPNARIAPIFLCHICSSWRTVALAAPTLWSHLSYRLTAWVIDWGIGNWVFLENEIAFLQWWIKNQGSAAPFLCLDFKIYADDPDGNDSDTSFDFPVAEDGMDFVVKYISRAQHLEIEPSFWNQVQILSESIYCVTFPNLHTLVTCQSPDYDYIDNHFLSTQILIGRVLVLEDTPSVLRRLAIVDTSISFSDTTIPTHWSILTHLSIANVCIPHHFWVSLTSAVPCLRWAYFSYTRQGTLDAHKNNNPIKRTLPHLSALLIVSADASLFSTFFAGLHLPALHDLFLSRRASLSTWWDSHGMADIDTVLRSAPALKKLTLRKHNRLSPDEIEYATGSLAAVDAVAPIWRRTTHLAHLRLELYITRDGSGGIAAAEELETFAQSAFCSNNRWLDVDNPACPIKTITVIDDTAKTASIRRKCVRKASRIAFHLISEQFTDITNLWKEWR